ncbi:MAG: hypothetical protein AAF206_00235 [Bacteroidota bacterium]
MHEAYEKGLGHPADFRVKYRFRSAAEGGRQSLPFQGIRCDFSFADEPGPQQYMIWPEFEDANGEPIMNKTDRLPVEGTARMWIADPRMRPVHYEKIKLGVKCHFREGLMYTADCEVIEILGLTTNPTT